MAKIGSPVIIAFSLDEEEESVASGNVQRRNVQRETQRQEYNGSAVIRTQQFTPTSSFRLTNIDSKLSAPDFEYGIHEESYRLEGAWTTTTTTT